MRTFVLLRLGLAAALAACSGDDIVAPPGPPYLAIVSLFDAPPGPDVEEHFGYHVQDVGGATTLDTTVDAAPTDTVILSLPSSTYRVTMLGLPGRCASRHGAQQDVPLAQQLNTNIARYYVNCQPFLNFTVYSFGPDRDPAFIYRLSRDGGPEQLGTVVSDSTTYINGLEPGSYTLSISHVAGHCVVISDGGSTQRFEIPATGGASRTFSVSCSDLTRRPKLTWLRGSYHDGAVGFIVRGTDPDLDITKFFWDLTDCAGTSVRPGGAVESQGIPLDRTAVDTATFVVGREVGIADAEMTGRCVAARLADWRGNTTPWVEHPLQETGQRPVATRFNAALVGQQATRLELEASDPDGDLVGTVVARRIRDGVLHPADGKDDFLYANYEGYLSTLLPDFPLGGIYPTHLDVNAVVAYLVDAGGNFSRHVDDDTFR